MAIVGNNVNATLTNVTGVINPQDLDDPIIYGGQTLSSDNNVDGGDSTFYPDVNSLHISAVYVSPVDLSVSGNTFIFGSNEIDSNNGTDQVFGQMEEFELTVSSNNSSEIAFISDNTFFFGGTNILSANGGDDLLIGQMNDFDLHATNTSGAEGAHISDNTFNFGSTVIQPENGSDLNGEDGVYIGAVKNFTLAADLNGAMGGYFTGQNNFNFGIGITGLLVGNTIKISNGDGAQLIGSLDQLTISAIDGGLIGTSYTREDIGVIAQGNNTFRFGDNTLEAGNGTDLELFGNMKSINLVAEGSSNLASAIGSLYGDGTNHFLFGNNSLTVGNGGDATLFGNAQEFSLIASNNGIIGNIVDDPRNETGYTYNNLLENPPSLIFDFSDNTLTADGSSKKADTLYGGLETFTISATENAVIQNTFIDLDDKIFNVMNGDNVLVGNFGSFSYTNDGTSLVQGNTINFGTNTFNVENGGSTIYGNVIDGSAVAAFIADSDIPTLDKLVEILPGLNGYDFTVYTSPTTLDALPFTGITPNGDLVSVGSGSWTTSQYIADEAISFLEGPDPNLTNFAMKVSAEFFATSTGDFTFYTISDDSSVLYIREHINNDDEFTAVVSADEQLHAAELHTGTYHLIEGQVYDIVVTYFNGPSLFTLSFGILDPTNGNIVNPGTNIYNLSDDKCPQSVDRIVLSGAFSVGENIINNWDPDHDILQLEDATPIITQAATNQITIEDDGQGGTLITFAPLDSNPNNVNGGTLDFTNIPYNNETLDNWIAINIPHIEVNV